MKKGLRFTIEQLQELIKKYGPEAKLIDIIKDLENK